MWCELFYDKYAGDTKGHGDHSFPNNITNKISMADLNDGSYIFCTGKDAIDFYNNKFKGYFSLPEPLSNADMFKISVYHKIQTSMEIIFTIVGINSIILEKYIELKKNIPYVDFVKSLCRFHLQYTNSVKSNTNSWYYNTNTLQQKINKNTDYIIEKTMTAVDYTIDTRIARIKELNIELFEYQKCSVHWMVNKEKNKHTISYNMNDEIIMGNVFYDMYNQKFNLINDRKKLTFYGGGVIDEVGLGKTLQIISLAIAHQATDTSYVKNNKFYSKATLIFCPNQLCGQWIRELGDKIKKPNNNENKSTNETTYEPIIISIMTKRDFDKLTYNDLLDADFVVVSFTFLDNKVFTAPWLSKINAIKSYNRKPWSVNDSKSIGDVFLNMQKELLKDPIGSLEQTNTLLPLIHWHRFVIDEFHEIYKDQTYTYIDNILPFITADNKWIMSATPFNQTDCLIEIVNFLTAYNMVDGNNILTLEPFVDYLSTDCFRRNTKDSVKQEHTLPPIKEEIRWLKFTPTERMIYNAYLTDPNNNKFSIYLRQLCCHPQLADETKQSLSNCKTLQDIEKTMVSHYKSEVDFAQEKVNDINVRITKVNKKIKKLERKQKKRQMKKLGINVKDSNSDDDSDDEEDDDDDLTLNDLDPDAEFELLNNTPITTLTMETLKDSLKKLDGKLKELTNVLNGKNATYNFFNNVIERIRKTASKAAEMSDTTSKSVLESTSAFKKIENESHLDKNIINALSGDTKVDDNDDEICGVCLGEIPEDNISVTKCGHIYCFECLKMVINKYHCCPYCKGKLGEKDYYVLSYERKKKTILTQEELNKEELINNFGTKLANLISFLRETKEHTIIFSQWDDLLKRVGRILKENSIPNVFCKGNCYQRDKAIREFNLDDKIKVIMLSSDSTAAGTNLTKASQVIFIDPIYGEYAFRKGQERQAIGRAHRLGQKSASIKIIRFIIKDSVEHEIYNMNIEEDKKHKNDFESTNEIDVI